MRIRSIRKEGLRVTGMYLLPVFIAGVVGPLVINYALGTAVRKGGAAIAVVSLAILIGNFIGLLLARR